jgi:hypothetical protein
VRGAVKDVIRDEMKQVQYAKEIDALSTRVKRIEERLDMKHVGAK